MNYAIQFASELPNGEINQNEYQSISFDNIEVGKYYFIVTDPLQNDIPYYLYSRVLQKDDTIIVIKTYYYKALHPPLRGNEVPWQYEAQVFNEEASREDVESSNFTFFVPRKAHLGGRKARKARKTRKAKRKQKAKN